MKPRKSQNNPQNDLFKSRLDVMLDHRRPLYKLANEVKWDKLEELFGSFYSEKGSRPGKNIRKMLALSILKHMFQVSDEVCVQTFVENPYWQYFAGMTHFSHEPPCDESSLSNFRKRIGEEGWNVVLAHSLEMAIEKKQLKKKDLKRITVDSTVMEKDIRFPTDARLLHRSCEYLVRHARLEKIVLRQSFVKVAKKALIKRGRYAAARQMKRAKKEERKLRTYHGRLLRDIERKAINPSPELESILEISRRIHEQKRSDKNKVYSYHEPHVECIAKGKLNKKYEFGVKVSISTTTKSNWITSAKCFHGNPYDGHTLEDVVEDIERNTKVKVDIIHADLGYRLKVADRLKDVDVQLTNRKKRSPSEKKWNNRRTAVEPIIGHLKEYHRMGRNKLKGKIGDLLQPVLSAIGFNFRKLLKAFLCLFLLREILNFLIGSREIKNLKI